jgi:hypothetical protein
VKEVIYGYWIRRSKDLLALAQQRMAQLEEVLGSAAADVSAEWDRSDDARGQPVVTLRLSDFAGSVTTVFDPKELESSEQMHDRFSRLWRDLLQIRIQQGLQELRSWETPDEG